jgi:hypothetical protein
MYFKREFKERLQTYFHKRNQILRFLHFQIIGFQTISVLPSSQQQTTRISPKADLIGICLKPSRLQL